MSERSSLSVTKLGPPVAALVLLGLVLLFIGNYGVRDEAETSAGAPVSAGGHDSVSVDLRFVDQPDGWLAVFDAGSGREIGRLSPEGDSFVRTVLKGLVRERHLRQVDPGLPFRLGRRSEGFLVLSDPSTGREVVLDAFGSTNAAAFGRFLTTTTPVR